MEINPALKNDLYHFYKGMKHEILTKLKHPDYYRENPFSLIGTNFFCNKLKFRVFDWLVQDTYKILLTKNKETGKYTFNWITYNKFYTELMIDTGKRRKLEKLSKCYDITQQCVRNYRTFKIDDIEIHCNIRYKSLLSKVFHRFGANQKCIVVKDNVKAMHIVIITKGEQGDEIEFIQSGSNS